MSQFVCWMQDKIETADETALLAYRDRAPFAVKNHPTDEHLMPLFSAIGAAGSGWNASKLHGSTDFGVLAMDAYAFN